MVNAVSSINAQPMYVVLTNGAVASANASIPQLQQAVAPLSVNPGIAVAPVIAASETSVALGSNLADVNAAQSAYQAASAVTAQLNAATVSFTASLAA